MSLALFVVLLTLIVIDPGPTVVDGVLLQALEAWRSPPMTGFVKHLTDLGGHHFMIPLGTVLVIGTFVRWRRAGFFLFVALIGSALLNEGMKMVVNRARPTIVAMVERARGLSFPSGHSQSTMALAVACFLLVWVARPRWRGRALLLFLLPLSVGWTRTYLGVHYPTDVLAGWSLGAIWVIACWAWFRREALGPFAVVPEAVDPPAELRGSARSSETEPVGSDSDVAAPPPG